MVQAVKLLPDRRVRQLSGHYADLGNRLKTPPKKMVNDFMFTWPRLLKVKKKRS